MFIEPHKKLSTPTESTATENEIEAYLPSFEASYCYQDNKHCSNVKGCITLSKTGIPNTISMFASVVTKVREHRSILQHCTVGDGFWYEFQWGPGVPAVAISPESTGIDCLIVDQPLFLDDSIVCYDAFHADSFSELLLVLVELFDWGVLGRA